MEGVSNPLAGVGGRSLGQTLFDCNPGESAKESRACGQPTRTIENGHELIGVNYD